MSSNDTLEEDEWCGHEEIYWGDGIRDLDTGVIEDPDYLGTCSKCGQWMVRFEDGRIDTV